MPDNRLTRQDKLSGQKGTRQTEGVLRQELSNFKEKLEAMTKLWKLANERSERLKKILDKGITSLSTRTDPQGHLQLEKFKQEQARLQANQSARQIAFKSVQEAVSSMKTAKSQVTTAQEKLQEAKKNTKAAKTEFDSLTRKLRAEPSSAKIRSELRQEHNKLLAAMKIERECHEGYTKAFKGYARSVKNLSEVVPKSNEAISKSLKVDDQIQNNLMKLVSEANRSGRSQSAPMLFRQNLSSKQERALLSHAQGIQQSKPDTPKQGSRRPN